MPACIIILFHIIFFDGFSLELLSLVSSLLPSLCVADQTPTAVAILSTTVAALQPLSPEELMLHQAQVYTVLLMF